MKKVLVVFCLLLVASPVFAAEKKFQLTVERARVQLGESVELRMKFDDVQNMPAPQIPPRDGFDTQYYGPSTMMQFINGKMSRSVTHVYSLRPLKEGQYHLGPFAFSYNGDRYVSNEITLTVESSGVSRGNQNVVSGSAQVGDVSLDDYVYLTMEVEKKKVYVNQIVPVIIKLYINQFSVREIQFPEIAHEGFSVADFDKPKQYREIVNGEYFDVVEFNTNIFATRTGEFSLGPAELECSLLLKRGSGRRRTSTFGDFFGDDFFDNFFASYDKKPITVKSSDIKFNVLSMPSEGKPRDFKGTLGSYNFTASISPKEVRVGDPITVTMKVEGKGNLNTVMLPQIESLDGFKTYDPHVTTSESGKTFEQILMPLDENVSAVPVITFSYFDVELGEYKTIKKGPFPIKVASVPEGEQNLRIVEMPHESAQPVIREVLGRDIVYIKEDLGAVFKAGQPLVKDFRYVAVHMLPPVLFFSSLILVKRQERLKTDVKYARRLNAPKNARKGINKAHEYLRKNDIEGFYDAVFKTLQEYIGNKFHVPVGGITVDAVNDIFKDKGIAVEQFEIMKKIFSDCDVARYAIANFKVENMQITYGELKTVIDYLEKVKL